MDVGGSAGLSRSVTCFKSLDASFMISLVKLNEIILTEMSP